MADNVAITAGSGTTISTEEVTTLNGGAVSAQHVQRMLAAIRTADGTAIDLPGDAANGLDVDVTRLPALPAGTNNIGDVDVLTVPADPFGANADAAVAAGAAGSIQAKLRRLTQGVEDLKTLIVLAAGSAEIGSVNQSKVAGTAVDVNSGNKSAGTQRIVIATDQPQLTNAFKVDGSAVTQPVSGTVALGAGSAAIGRVDVGSALPAGTAAIGDVGLVPRTSGGLTVFRSVDLDESEEEVKGTAGQVFGFYFSNRASSPRFVRFYDDTAANVTVGTTTPLAGPFELPAQTGSCAGVVVLPHGVRFARAICVAATTGLADSDTGAPGANEVLINVFYA